MGKRVLLTTDVVGGVWDFCMLLASELRVSPDTSVTVLALGKPSGGQRVLAASIGARLLSAPLKLEWMRDSDADVKRTQELVADVVRDVRPDVLHANQFATASVQVDVPVVLTLHSDVLSWFRWTSGMNDVRADWRSYAALVERGCQNADSVVAVSGFLANEIQTLYDVGRPIRIIYNGWPIPAPSAAERERITLVAGRVWDAAKNVNLAGEAAQGWDAGAVYLAGELAHPESGGAVDVEAPLIPLGFLSRPELDRWLRRSAIYLSPARYDPFGLLPLQAALSGCVLLLSDIPSYRELWDGAACFFRSNDAGDLRVHWQRLLEDRVRRESLQQRASERARNRYSSSRMADAYRGLYARAQRAVAA
jgi:glycosyltransferase involved in cell wall biosynthesis